jgi:hypothetical protein
MNALDILELAQRHGVQVQAREGQLLLEADQQPPLEIINLLKQHKPDLLAYLTAGQAPLIEPLDHANDEPTPLTAWERLKQRAIGAYDYLLRLSVSNLVANGYSDRDAMVYRQDWRSSIKRAMHLSDEQIDRLERELIQDGVLAYSGARTYLVLGNGLKQPSVYAENPDFMLADDTGRTFTHWLYS